MSVVDGTVSIQGPRPVSTDIQKLSTPELFLLTHPDYGIASSGSSTTLTDNSKNWDVNQWTGWVLVIVAGPGAGQERVVASNTATVITVQNAFSTTSLPGAASIYKITTAGFLLESAANPNLRVSIFQLGTEGQVGTFGSDAFATSNNGLLVTAAVVGSIDGVNLRTQRISNIFKTADASAVGNTTVWTPAAGKKFRVIRIFLTIDGSVTLAAAASELITFTDSGTAIGIGVRVFLPSAVGTIEQDVVIAIDLGPNGFLSAAANNVFQINLGTVLAAGNIRVTAIGTEE